MRFHLGARIRTPKKRPHHGRVSPWPEPTHASWRARRDGPDVNFELAVAGLLVGRADGVRPSGQLDPAGAGQLGVDHEAQDVLEVALVSLQGNVSERMARQAGLDDPWRCNA